MLALAFVKNLDGAAVTLLDIGLGDLGDRLALLDVITDRDADRREPSGRIGDRIDDTAAIADQNPFSRHTGRNPPDDAPNEGGRQSQTDHAGENPVKRPGNADKMVELFGRYGSLQRDGAKGPLRQLGHAFALRFTAEPCKGAPDKNSDRTCQKCTASPCSRSADNTPKAMLNNQRGARINLAGVIGLGPGAGHGFSASRPPSETRRIGLSSSGILQVSLKMVATGVRNSGLMFAAFGAASGAARAMKSWGLGLAIILLAPGVCSGGVLTEGDLKKVEDIKPLFQNLMGDLVQTSKRSDISSGDADCVKSTIRELLQISEELSSYEYLITIEREMTDFGDNNPMRGIVKFAAEKSNSILADERKRLAQLSDQCARYPLSVGKMQQALQFIDTTTNVLTSIQARL
jgi:hypothetical protein